jgi:hypothetical protein
VVLLTALTDRGDGTGLRPVMVPHPAVPAQIPNRGAARDLQKWRQIKQSGRRDVMSGRGVEPRTHGLTVRPWQLSLVVPPSSIVSVPSVLPVLPPLLGTRFGDRPSAVVRPLPPARGSCRHGCRQVLYRDSHALAPSMHKRKHRFYSKWSVQKGLTDE